MARGVGENAQDPAEGGGMFRMKQIYSLPCLKGAVCAGGTRLPPTEPTGEIGTTIRWRRDMSFSEMNENRTVSLHRKAF